MRERKARNEEYEKENEQIVTLIKGIGCE
jgi:hypothetical protein